MTTYISPPFGNYIKYNDCIRIRGTYTWRRRPGLIKQCIKTIRPIKGGWINAIGFRNSGLCEIQNIYDNDIYSIAALDNNWLIFIDYIRNRPNTPKSIEINIGCPNVTEIADISDYQLERYVEKFPNLTIKLPPTITLDYVRSIYQLGVRKFHFSNTLPVHIYTDNGIIKYGYVLES